MRTVDEHAGPMWTMAADLGIPCSPSTCASGECPWAPNDQGVLVLHGSTMGDGITGMADWWHEIAHALCVPREWWVHAGWGLGMVYDGSEGGPVLSTCSSVEDEIAASVLGIWLQEYVGKDPKGASFHLAAHAWNPYHYAQEVKSFWASGGGSSLAVEYLKLAGYPVPG